MSIRSGQKKWKGSAASYVRYTNEDEINSAETDLAYHDRPKDGVVFDLVGGKAIDHLPGLNRSIGLLKDQHADLHDGRWDGVQYLKRGYVKQWQVDDKGRFVHVVNPETGKKERVPVIDPETGKQAFTLEHTAGYDLTYSLSKDCDEYLVAHPEDVPVMREALLAAATKAQQIGVEDYAKVVRVPVLTPKQDAAQDGGRQSKSQGSVTERQTAAGLVWWASFGASARPTPESEARGYGADPLTHLHVFTSSMAMCRDGKWRTIEGAGLMRTAAFRRDVADVAMAIELESRGFELEYGDVDRKTGRVPWVIKGSRAENRAFFSTNAQRRHDLQQKYEDEHNQPMSDRQLDRVMQATKGAKTEAAKIADRGYAEQYGLWREALLAEGHELSMPKRSGVHYYAPERERLAELHSRLESQQGVARFATDKSVFTPDAVLPATMRAGVGLGFTPERLVELAGVYLENHLEVVRKATAPDARYLTTRTIKKNELRIEKGLDKLAEGFGPSIRREVITAVMDRQKSPLADEQRKIVRKVLGPDKLVVALGPAGSGKGRLLNVVSEAIRETDDFNELVVTAVAAQRAAKLGKELHADRGGSVESLYRQWQKGWRPTARTVLVVDEAAVMNTFDCAKLMEVAGGKAKVVLVGDLSQQKAIGVSGWLEHEVAKREPLWLHQVHRQPDQRDRDMLNHIRTGRTQLAVHDLHRRNRIFVSQDPESQVLTVAGRYAMYRDAGFGVREVAIVHVGENTELDRYNRAVQRYRAQHGEIDMTASYVVSEGSSGRRWTIAQGDRVTFLDTHFSGLTTPVRNGESGEVLKVDSTGRCRVRLDGDERRTITVQLKPEMERVPLGLEYGQSASRFQGNEVKVALCTEGSPGVVSKNSIYSQLSRMQTHAEVFVDQERWGENPIAVMPEVFAREVSSQTATDYMRQFGEEISDEEAPEMTFEESLSLAKAQQEDIEIDHDQGHDFGMGF